MKIASWNVNGLRSCIGKGFYDYFKALDADIFCVQETKMQKDQAEVLTEGYLQFWNSAEKKGYSGTLTASKREPLACVFGIEGKHSDEGRVITLEFPEFYMVNCYVPNAQPELARLVYRMEFEDDLREYLSKLDGRKPVVYCGDLNVAHEEIDLARPKANVGNPGFSDEEREKFSKLLSSGFTDTFRHLHPDEKLYSWWSYRAGARANNVGWRIDYFLVSDRIAHKVRVADIHCDVYGSDHCPVFLEIDL